MSGPAEQINANSDVNNVAVVSVPSGDAMATLRGEMLQLFEQQNEQIASQMASSIASVNDTLRKVTDSTQVILDKMFDKMNVFHADTVEFKRQNEVFQFELQELKCRDQQSEVATSVDSHHAQIHAQTPTMGLDGGSGYGHNNMSTIYRQTGNAMNESILPVDRQLFSAVVFTHRLDKLQVKELLEFEDAVLLQQQETHSLFLIQKFVHKSILSQIQNRFRARIGHGTFNTLSAKTLIEYMKVMLRPENQMKFFESLQLNVQFQLTEVISFQNFMPLVDALLSYCGDYRKIYTCIADKNTDSLPNLRGPNSLISTFNAGCGAVGPYLFALMPSSYKPLDMIEYVDAFEGYVNTMNSDVRKVVGLDAELSRINGAKRGTAIGTAAAVTPRPAAALSSLSALDDLSAIDDEYRPKGCFAILIGGGCRKGNDCKFAHDLGTLESTRKYVSAKLSAPISRDFIEARTAPAIRRNPGASLNHIELLDDGEFAAHLPMLATMANRSPDAIAYDRNVRGIGMFAGYDAAAEHKE
jgi:hypothetical protein